MSKDKLVENGFARLPKWEDAVERYANLLKKCLMKYIPIFVICFT